jgi:hypothetical protein
MNDEWKYSTMEEAYNYKDWEFVFVDSEIQKKLNQWRHTYLIRILAMDVVLGSTQVLLIEGG